jgi:hypothetical protein
MSCNWKVLCSSVLLCSLLLTMPSQAGSAGGVPPPNPASAEAVAKQLDALKKALAEIERDLKQALGHLERDVELGTQNTQREIDDLKKQVGKLQQEVEALTKRLAVAPNVASLYGPPPAATGASPPSVAPAPSSTGRVQLVNGYTEVMTILVNNQSYMVMPGETRIISPVPTGTFTYQVLGVQPQLQTRTLAANETFTITIQPPR